MSLIHTLIGHINTVSSVSLGQKYLATGSCDDTVKLWDLESGKLIYSLTGHSNQVNSVSLGPNEKYLATGSNDYTAKLWDLTSGKLLHTFTGNIIWVWVSLGQKYLATGGPIDLVGGEPGLVKLWDLDSKKLLRTFTGHRIDVTSVSLGPNKKYLATGSLDDTAKLWDLDSGNLIHTFTQDNTCVTSLSLGRKYLATNSGFTAKLWDLKTGKLLRTFIEPTPSYYTLTSVSLGPNEKYLATGSKDNTAKLWDLESGNLLHTFTGHSDYVYSVSLGSKYLATGSRDGTAKLWDLNDIPGPDFDNVHEYIRMIFLVKKGRATYNTKHNKILINLPKDILFSILDCAFDSKILG